jgi:hypothetical protein
MPLPFTRPINHTAVAQDRDALARGNAPDLNLPPSNGQSLPFSQGIVHTVKNPGHQVPTRSRTVPAQVT